MKVIVATNSSDGYTYVIGVWDASKYSSEDVQNSITEDYKENHGYEPEFGDHAIEISCEEVVA
ncbi:MAG: hypothetical protein ACRDCE_07460 [Cetobacterium sp.]|uniref:hypothetical protein n=1 Tax=Cetobacterium sp. TaxID=2071632 RepID=UPI003EE816D3